MVWKKFNNFYVSLDRRPRKWEDRIVLFTAQLIRENKQSSTVKSYISAIKGVLGDLNIAINENSYLLRSLIRACKLTNDTYRLRLPIQRDVLNLILKTTRKHFMDQGQVYLCKLYLALFSTAYFGLFRVGEITFSEHVVKVCDVQVATNKRKMMFILRSSKTQGLDKKPQIIKISSENICGTRQSNKETDNKQFCPYQLLNNYSKCRRRFKSASEPFSVFL